MPKLLKNRLVWLTVIWAGLIGAGGYAMLLHDFDGHIVKNVPDAWPVALGDFNENDHNLVVVMAVHPDCPCTRASLEQIDRVLTRNQGRAEAFVLFSSSESHAAEFGSVEQSDYWKRVEKMPGARPVNDIDARIAQQLQMVVSGTLVAYNRTGELCFHGGITPSRGHEGTCPGYTMLMAMAQGKAVETGMSALAFGCALGEGDTQRESR